VWFSGLTLRITGSEQSNHLKAEIIPTVPSNSQQWRNNTAPDKIQTILDGSRFAQYCLVKFQLQRFNVRF
jgi:hypothetical protein